MLELISVSRFYQFQDNSLTCHLVTSIYMSNGKCQDNCQGGYAFAVLLGQSCWCSDYIPANQDSTSLCSDSCPGFPDDTCGNQAKGLYGYFALNIAPSGTAGGSSQSSAAQTSSSKPSVSTKPAPITLGSSYVPVRSSRSSASSFSFSVDVSVLTPYVSSQSSAESSSSSLSSSTVSEIISHTRSSSIFSSHLSLCASVTSSFSAFYMPFPPLDRALADPLPIVKFSATSSFQ